ncbi:uncharacterized protein UTRI_00709 [Ustilago trichophora]|uniref:Uncharacterized protein n=1 Tax=Ustilago trichophora TaxID=86804 RepID=A0A5C3DSP4_9BASI|nr:uncharacterized protein UTRI_00709 [Ustilago trichophora]
MYLTGRLSLQRSWWLLFAVLAYVWLFTVSSAAPLSEDEIQPAPEEAVASTSQVHRAPSFQASEALPGSRVSRSTSSDNFKFPNHPDRFASSAQAVPQAVKSRITLSELHMTRMQRFKASLQRLTVKGVTNLFNRYQRFKRRRRAKKFGPRRGEVEIRPVFAYTKEEVRRGGPPVPRKLSKAEEIEVLNALSPYHRASYEAIRRTSDSFEPDPRVLAAELRRQPKIEKARAEKLAAEAHARAVAAGGAGESSRPLRAFEPTAHEERAAEARILPLGEDGAGVSVRPLQATKHASRVGPNLRTSTSQRVATLSRSPSSEWDKEGLQKQAEKRIEQGFAVINDALHAQALPRVILHKRSPPISFAYVQDFEYPGQHYRIVKVENGKFVYRLSDPASTLSDRASLAKSWEEMEQDERKQVYEAVVEPLETKREDYNKEPAERIKSLPSQKDGSKYLGIPGKGPTILRAYRDGHNNWLWEDLANGKGSQLCVPAENLPVHLKDFVSNIIGDTPHPPSFSPARVLRRSLPSASKEKRSPLGGLFRSRTQEQDPWIDLTGQHRLQYRGEGYQVIRSRGGGLLFADWAPHKDRAHYPRYFHNLQDSEKQKIEKTIPIVKKLRKNGWDESKVSNGFRVSSGPRDATGVYYLPDRIAHEVKVKRKGDRFKFEILKETRFGPPQRTWVELNDLPQHMKDFLRWEASTDLQQRLPWTDILSGLRPRSLRRSLPSLRLKKRAGPADPSTSEPTPLKYPSQKLEIRKPPSGYSFSVLSEDSVTQDYLEWPSLTDGQKDLFRRAYPRIDDVIQGKLDERSAGLVFERDPVMDFPLATKTLPAETIWIVQESSPLLHGQKRLLFFRNHPATSSDYKTVQELPEYLQTWLYRFHRNIYIEAGGPIQEAKRPLYKSIPASNSDKIRPMASSSKPIASTSKPEKELLEYPGQMLEIRRSEAGEHFFTFLTSNPNGHQAFPKWSGLEKEDQARVRSVVPKVDDWLIGKVDDTSAGLQFEESQDWAKQLAIKTIRPPETIFLVRRKGNLLRPGKMVFLRSDPVTFRLIPSAFKQLPAEVQHWISVAHADIYREATGAAKVIKHPLRKRADLGQEVEVRQSHGWTPSPSQASSSNQAVGNGNRILLEYPGRNLLLHDTGGKLSFSFPIDTNLDPNHNMQWYNWESLNDEQRQWVQNSIEDIERNRANPTEEFRNRFKFQKWKVGDHDVKTATIPIKGQEPQRFWLERKRTGLRKKWIIHRLDSAGKVYEKLKFKQLSGPVRGWFEAQFPALFKEVSKSASTSVLRPWKRRGLSPGILDPNYPYERLQPRADQASSSRWSSTLRWSSTSRQAASIPNKELPLLHSVDYPGERLTLTKAQDGTYVFNFLRPIYNAGSWTSYQTRSWAGLPRGIKGSLAGIPHLREVAKSRMPVDKAREKPVMVANDPFDLGQAHSHPLRLAEKIRVLQNGNKIVFQRILRHRVAAPVEYSSLPEHLQNYLWQNADVRNLLQRAAGHVRKRGLSMSRGKDQEGTFAAGPSTGSKTAYVPLRVDQTAISQILPERKPPGWRPYNLPDSSYHFKRFFYPGGQGFDVRHDEYGYGFMRARLSDVDFPLVYRSFGELSREDQKEIRILIPDISNMLRHHKERKKGLAPSRSFHFLPDQRPEEIWETIQNGELTYHRHPLQNGGGYSFEVKSNFAQLPEDLRNFIETAKQSGRSFVRK